MFSADGPESHAARLVTYDRDMGSRLGFSAAAYLASTGAQGSHFRCACELVKNTCTSTQSGLHEWHAPGLLTELLPFYSVTIHDERRSSHCDVKWIELRQLFAVRELPCCCHALFQ